MPHSKRQRWSGERVLKGDELPRKHENKNQPTDLDLLSNVVQRRDEGRNNGDSSIGVEP